MFILISRYLQSIHVSLLDTCNYKALHMFDCTVAADQTEEGCSKSLICLEYNITNKSIYLENKTTENWEKQGASKVVQPKKKRSVKSYLNKHPYFEHVIFNKKVLFK